MLLSDLDAIPVVERIVDSLRRSIDERVLRSGMRLPSIRQFAAAQNVSRFSVVEAYDRLVALGYLRSKRGSGFYVAARSVPREVEEHPARLDRAVDVVWLMRQMLNENPDTLKTGSGWLPRQWLDEEGLQRQIRALTRRPEGSLTEYGHPFGYAPLRNQLQRRLAEVGIAAEPRQIVLTHGASQALDIVIRYLLKPGDAVLVDDPGYYTLFGNLKLHGVRLIGVPRTQHGPDTDSLERLAQQHRPKVYFTQSVVQNPTGTTMLPPVAFRVLQIAEKCDLTVVEDDVFADSYDGSAQRLAALDQLQRVIYVGSFSKTLSKSLRVGFLACRREVAEDLADIKMLSCISTSEFNERLVHQMLVEGHYRKHLGRLRGRLREVQAATLRKLEKSGLKIFCEPDGGLFVCARVPGKDNAADIASKAAKSGIVLAPGNVFRPHLEPSPWLRFNVAFCDNPRLYRFLDKL
jgi:DNA-binding transcriptional MocR family regulator